VRIKNSLTQNPTASDESSGKDYFSGEKHPKISKNELLKSSTSIIRPDRKIPEKQLRLLEFLPDCNEENSGLQIKHKSRERRDGKKREERKEGIASKHHRNIQTLSKNNPPSPPQKKNTGNRGRQLRAV